MLSQAYIFLFVRINPSYHASMITSLSVSLHTDLSLAINDLLFVA